MTPRFNYNSATYLGEYQNFDLYCYLYYGIFMMAAINNSNGKFVYCQLNEISRHPAIVEAQKRACCSFLFHLHHV